MTSAVAGTTGWRAAMVRHERTLAICWIVAVLLGLGALTVGPVRVRLLDALQSVVTRWESRWTRRLAYGEELYRQGKYAEAAAYLERLDQEFPARSVRHSQDKERERLLTLLGRSYAALQKKGKAMATFSRLVAFDSLNYHNHYEQALAAGQLLSSWALASEARDAYSQVLVLNPYHLPSVRGTIDYYSDQGQFIPMVLAYKKYLDALLFQRVRVTLGDSTVQILVPVDGLPHEFPVALPAPRGWSGTITINPTGFASTLEAAWVTPAADVGIVARRSDVSLAVDKAETKGMKHGPRGSLIPDDDQSTLSITVPSQPSGIEAVRLRLRLFKPMDQKMWAIVSRGYHNLIDGPGFADADVRTVPFPSAEAADSVLLRLPWAREGQELIVNDRGE